MMTPPNLTTQQMLIIFVLFTLVAIPSGMLLKRSGRNPLWAILVYVPVLAVIGLWVLALRGPNNAA